MLTANFAAGGTWRNSHRKGEGAAVLRITHHWRGNIKAPIENSKLTVRHLVSVLLFTIDDVLEELNGPALQKRGRDNGLQNPKDQKSDDRRDIEHADGADVATERI